MNFSWKRRLQKVNKNFHDPHIFVISLEKTGLTPLHRRRKDWEVVSTSQGVWGRSDFIQCQNNLFHPLPRGPSLWQSSPGQEGLIGRLGVPSPSSRTSSSSKTSTPRRRERGRLSPSGPLSVTYVSCSSSMVFRFLSRKQVLLLGFQFQTHSPNTIVVF